MDVSPEAWTFAGVVVVQLATVAGIAVRYGRKSVTAAKAVPPTTDTATLKAAIRLVLREELKEIKEDVKEVRREVTTHLRDHAVTFGHEVTRQRAGR